MQIYELTQPKKSQIDEVTLPSEWAAQKAKQVGGALKTGAQAAGNIAGKVGAGIQGARAGIQDAGVARQAAELSKRGYDAWSKYARQLTAQYGQDANFKNMYKQQLLAFVQKNLLGGAYLPNLTNKDQILKSVDDLVAVRFAAPIGGAGAFGQMAQQLGQGPAVGTQTASNTGGTTTTTPTGVVHKAKAPIAPTPGVKAGKAPSTQAKPGQMSAEELPVMLGGKKLDPNNPNDAKVLAQIKTQGKLKETQLREAVDVAKEKQLFQKLVKDSLLASAVVATGQAAGNKTPGDATTAANKQVQDPTQMIPDVQQLEKVKANVDERTLATVGAVLRQNYQLDPSIRSTGDDAVDALLLAMGFKV